jgi:hypothetical protein
MILTGKTAVVGQEPVQVPLCPPQISYKLTWGRTGTFRASPITKTDSFLLSEIFAAYIVRTIFKKDTVCVRARARVCVCVCVCRVLSVCWCALCSYCCAGKGCDTRDCMSDCSRPNSWPSCLFF